MTYEQAWKTLFEMMDVSDLYGSKDPDLQYLLGFIDGLRNAMKEVKSDAVD